MLLWTTRFHIFIYILLLLITILSCNHLNHICKPVNILSIRFSKKAQVLIEFYMSARATGAFDLTPLPTLNAHRKQHVFVAAAQGDEL